MISHLQYKIQYKYSFSTELDLTFGWASCLKIAKFIIEEIFFGFSSKPHLSQPVDFQCPYAK